MRGRVRYREGNKAEIQTELLREEVCWERVTEGKKSEPGNEMLNWAIHFN